ncbi:unnamed protein product [Cyprideis torosa]|uniref:Uncharacterized protein n=1 Tax=Cyprideis torosa TaxID=163714 RepID=A0A7R8ZGC3_9CRUS|nr:unnamed protein product [Cyprideis torosa]CAG0879720.1 unnamed protein product [Cyprideis torosa]
MFLTRGWSWSRCVAVNRVLALGVPGSSHRSLCCSSHRSQYSSSNPPLMPEEDVDYQLRHSKDESRIQDEQEMQALIDEAKSAAPGNSEAEEEPSGPPVIVDRLLEVTTISINRPHRKNAVNPETARLLYEAFMSFEKDDTSPVAVLRGVGGTFCSGYDLKDFAETMESLRPSRQNAYLDQIMNSIDGPMGPTRWFSFSKPVIAAIDGYCVAGGLELALCCDMRVAEEQAVFGVFNRKIGVPLIDGGTIRLPNLIGLSRAMDLILTGRLVDASEAFQLGLVNRLTAVGTSFGSAVKIARSMAKLPQRSLLADRRSAYYSQYRAVSWEDAACFERDNARLALMKEAFEGAKTFSANDKIHKRGLHFSKADEKDDNKRE